MIARVANGWCVVGAKGLQKRVYPTAEEAMRAFLAGAAES